jgi:hypothetical protein
LGIADSDPERGTSLALEAIDESRSPLAFSSLRVALSNLPDLLVSVSPDAGIYDPVGVAFAPDERRVVIVDKQAGARVLDVESGQSDAAIKRLEAGLEEHPTNLFFLNQVRILINGQVTP